MVDVVVVVVAAVVIDVVLLSFFFFGLALVVALLSCYVWLGLFIFCLLFCFYHSVKTFNLTTIKFL